MKPIEIHSCAKEKSIMSFPMGALCIKTEINRCEGLPHSELFEHFTYEDPVKAAGEAASRHPWAVGLSVYIWNSDWFETFARTLRKADGSILIFAGGPHTTAYTAGLPDWLDFAVLGEGEISTLSALSSIVAGKKAENLQIEGIITRNYVSPVSSRLPELSRLHSPFLTGEADGVLRSYDSVLWELTRGCPFACAFCFESRGKRTVRDYPLDRIQKELDYLIPPRTWVRSAISSTASATRQAAAQSTVIITAKVHRVQRRRWTGLQVPECSPVTRMRSWTSSSWICPMTLRTTSGTALQPPGAWRAL